MPRLRSGAATGAVLSIAMLATAATAGARPSPEELGTAPAPAPEPVTASAPAPTSADVVIHHDGTDALTIIAVAGGTLLVGAAGGFGSGRLVARRHAVQP
jgi:hypothetical protein